MYYPFILYALLSLLPAFFLYFYPINKRKRIRRIVLTAISFIVFFIMTHHLSDLYLYQYWFAMIPYFIIGLYAGKSYLIYTALAAVAMHTFYFQTTLEFLLFVTSLFINTIVCLLIYRKYHELQYKNKIFLVLGGFLLAGVINSLVFLQSSFNQMQQQSELISWGYAISSCIYVCTMFVVFTIIIKQYDNEHIIYSYQLLEKNYETELNMWGQLLQFAPYAVLCVTEREEISYANEKAFSKYSTLTRIGNNHISQGQMLSTIMKEDCYNEVSQMIKDVYEKKVSVCINQNSDDRYFLITVLPIMSSTGQAIISVSVYVQDITELQMLRSEVDHMDRLSLVGQMAASITHEIRNPMAVIRGFVQLLQEKSSSIQREYYRIIIDELDRANAIITDFLALAKQKGGSKEVLQINTIVNEISPLLIADANFRGQAIVFLLEDKLPLLLLNEREIKQLLLNITRNAMEAMGEGGTVQILTSKQADGVVLSIVDEGAGVPNELKQKIFEPFYSSKNNGTGLGLPLCADIVKRHDASIDVLDNESYGSIFCIRFPVPPI